MARVTFAVAFVLLTVGGCSSDESNADVGGGGGLGGAAGNGGSGGAAAGGVAGAGGSAGLPASGGAAGIGGVAGSGGMSGGAGAPVAGMAGAPGCVTSEFQPLKDGDSYATARFAYPSQGLKVYGETCQPKTGGPHPVVVWNHGGMGGLGDSDRQLCESLAGLGYAVVMSEYRGEGGSEGKIEVCLGEADDIISLIACVKGAPQLDSKRILMAGASHGGCITLRAIQKGATSVAAVDIFGPTDWTHEHAFWTAELAKAPQGPWAPTYKALLEIVETATGGTPSQVPAEYQQRSPVAFAPALTAYPGSLLIVQGTQDTLVPARESCAIAGLAGGFEARHFAEDANALLASAPAGCESSGLVWLMTPKPAPGWAGQRHLEVYEGAGHGFSQQVPGEAAMVEDFATFLTARLPL